MNIDETRPAALLPAFVRLTIPFWRSRAARRAWVLALVIGVGFYVSAKMAIWGNSTSGDITNAVVAKKIDVLRPAVGLYVLIVVAAGLIATAQRYIEQWIAIDWRRHMTDRLYSAWLTRGNYYRMERDRTIDNADQRIAEDCFLFIEHTIHLILALVGLPVTMYIYGMLLWTLGGSIDLAAVGIDMRLAGGLFWIAAVGLGAAVGALLAIGYPLIRLNVERQRREADFRFALANIRIDAEQIALYGGTAAEAARLDRRFGGIVANWHRVMLVTSGTIAATTLYLHLTGAVGFVLGYGRYAAGQIDFGQVTQIGSAVSGFALAIYTLIEYLRSGHLHIWAASVRRLDALHAELIRPLSPGIAVVTAAGESAVLSTHDLRLARPDGSALADIGNLSFAPGERWLVQGASGVGKSTMIRALAGLWPYGSGEVCRDDAAHMLFLPQKSYVPEGSLFDALCYPSPPDRFTPQACADMLARVRLGAFADRLHEQAPWQQRLSPGEQQRLAFARILLQRPTVILLDEATSALDPDTERQLYNLLERELPDATVISVAHRETLELFHPHRLTLSADGTAQSSYRDRP